MAKEIWIPAVRPANKIFVVISGTPGHGQAPCTNEQSDGGGGNGSEGGPAAMVVVVATGTDLVLSERAVVGRRVSAGEHVREGALCIKGSLALLDASHESGHSPRASFDVGVVFYQSTG